MFWNASDTGSLLYLGSCDRTALFVLETESAGGQSGRQKPPSRPMTPPDSHLLPLTRHLRPKAEGIIEPTVGFASSQEQQTVKHGTAMFVPLSAGW